MASYLIRAKGETAIEFKISADIISELQHLVDAKDDPSAFEYSPDRRDEAKREWRPVIPIGETYIPGVGAVPAIVADMEVFANAARLSGCGKSD